MGRARAGRRRRQLQPGDDARGARRPLAQGRRGQRAARGARRRRSPSSARCPATTGTSRCSSWFGIDMVTVPMNDDGPDAEAVAQLAATDPSIKGMWVVPTYANPSGSVVSQEVAARLASMETAAPDFKIFWDNAYAFHHLTEDEAKSADMLTLAAAAGPPAPADHVRLDLEDHLRRRRRGVPGRLGRDREVVRRPPRQGLDRPGQAQPAAPPAVLRLAPGRARPHDPAPRDHRAEVRRGASACSTERLGGLEVATWTTADRRLLRQPRRAATAPRPGWSRWPRRPASR